MLDKTDKKIIAVLQEDGRIPNKDIAAKVGMVPSAISERLKKLREKNVILGFETRLNPDALDKTLLAFVFVKTNETAHGWDTGNRLAEIDEIQEVYNIAGEDCYLVKVRVKDTFALSSLIREKIGLIETVTSTRTTIVMESYKESCKMKID